VPSGVLASALSEIRDREGGGSKSDQLDDNANLS